MLNGLWWSFQLLVATAVAALTANLYYNGGAGFGYAIHPYVYQGVLAAVLLGPVFWAAAHLCGGVLLGVAGGSFFDALKFALILGLGMAVSKLWLFVLAAGVGVWAGGGPLIYVVGGAVLGGLLFGLDKAMAYFWNGTRHWHDD